MKRILPQRCPVLFLYLTWTLYGVGMLFLLLRGDYVAALAWAILFPLALWGYVVVFPRISQYLGYGRVEDTQAGEVGRRAIEVTMYGSLGCPFCPIVERRLEALREKMTFELRHVDLTVRPDLARAKGIRSVPVVEVGGRRIVGHATTRELADFLREAAPDREE